MRTRRAGIQMYIRSAAADFDLRTNQPERALRPKTMRGYRLEPLGEETREFVTNRIVRGPVKLHGEQEIFEPFFAGPRLVDVADADEPPLPDHLLVLHPVIKVVLLCGERREISHFC